MGRITGYDGAHGFPGPVLGREPSANSRGFTSSAKKMALKKQGLGAVESKEKAAEKEKLELAEYIASLRSFNPEDIRSKGVARLAPEEGFSPPSAFEIAQGRGCGYVFISPDGKDARLAIGPKHFSDLKSAGWAECYNFSDIKFESLWE